MDWDVRGFDEAWCAPLRVGGVGEVGFDMAVDCWAVVREEVVLVQLG